ncbi:hypothetical protein [Anaerotruncus massiliensis (ex Liu et al. 2021)]|uniref:hypothetical protein n=1 Tax=Anaerotruncus massiliensis (ex Liu et al. 2021) TaxID=2321404 RepID=UPI0025905C74|nr:hypothetical protein [uncultured Anaerotruncus sp.]
MEVIVVPVFAFDVFHRDFDRIARGDSIDFIGKPIGFPSDIDFPNVVVVDIRLLFYNFYVQVFIVAQQVIREIKRPAVGDGMTRGRFCLGLYRVRAIQTLFRGRHIDIDRIATAVAQGGVQFKRVRLPEHGDKTGKVSQFSGQFLRDLRFFLVGQRVVRLLRGGVILLRFLQVRRIRLIIGVVVSLVVLGKIDRWLIVGDCAGVRERLDHVDDRLDRL